MAIAMEEEQREDRLSWWKGKYAFYKMSMTTTIVLPQ
jgi:hypothetical protein